MANQKFRVTEDHIILLKHAYVGWDDGEYGAPAIDCKRPYGNSSVEYDIIEILGLLDEFSKTTTGPIITADVYLAMHPEIFEKARKVHIETQTALQIFLNTGQMAAGEYERISHNEWKLVALKA